MFGFGMPELIVIMSIVLVIFGAGKLPEVGRAVGKGIRNFKEASEGKEALNWTKRPETVNGHRYTRATCHHSRLKSDRGSPFSSGLSRLLIFPC